MDFVNSASYNLNRGAAEKLKSSAKNPIIINNIFR
jgi:hypothetical protein